MCVDGDVYRQFEEYDCVNTSCQKQMALEAGVECKTDGICILATKNCRDIGDLCDEKYPDMSETNYMINMAKDYADPYLCNKIIGDDCMFSINYEN